MHVATVLIPHTIQLVKYLIVRGVHNTTTFVHHVPIHDHGFGNPLVFFFRLNPVHSILAGTYAQYIHNVHTFETTQADFTVPESPCDINYITQMTSDYI